MTIDAALLSAARAAEARLVEAERAADLARAEFRYAVRKLHLAGGSLREIGEALKLSHQRVHQIVEEAGGGRGWRGFTVGGRTGAGGEPLACSFCGKHRKQVGELIAGPGGVYVCDECVVKAGQVIETGKVAATPVSAVKPVPADAAAKCSFCGKCRHQVDGLARAAGTTTAGVSICTECLALCQEIMAET